MVKPSGLQNRMKKMQNQQFWGITQCSKGNNQQQERFFSSLDSKTSSSSKLHRANLEYCVDLVKKHDVENYMIGSLHIPREFRASFFAIHSFNIEVALIRSQGKKHIILK